MSSQIIFSTIFMVLVVQVLGASLDLDLNEDFIDHHDLEFADSFVGFVSYRRANSKHLAMLVKVLLERENISTFIDVEDLEGGLWHDQLMENISNSPNFLLVLSNGSLERCKGDFNYTDIMHQEIKQAVDGNKRIVPIFDDFDFPSSEFFSPEINFALNHQGLFWEHKLVNQTIQRLISYMRIPIKSLQNEHSFIGSGYISK